MFYAVLLKKQRCYQQANSGNCCLLRWCSGNKCDLESERQVEFETACSLANERGMLAALETSAKV